MIEDLEARLREAEDSVRNLVNLHFFENDTIFLEV